MKALIPTLVALVFALGNAAQADSGGGEPGPPALSMSPDGHLLVRIYLAPFDLNAKGPPAPAYKVTYYEFDAAADAFTARSTFQLNARASPILHVSNAGDLVMINLSEAGAIRLYSRDGTLKKTWNLSDFLTKAEIQGCAQTGSTLQWFDEGKFVDREFHFVGPSLRIRLVQPPYSIMRGRNEKMSFSATINAQPGKLVKHESK